MSSSKALVTLLLVILLGVVAACAPAAAPAPTPAPTQAPAATKAPEAAPAATVVAEAAAATGKEVKDLKIGYIYLTLEHPYYQAHSKHVQDYAKELGFTLIERDGKQDAAVQASAMEDLIAQKVDGIVFCLADEAASVPAIQEAQKAGIPVVTFAIHHGEEANAPFVGIPEAEATEKAGIEAAKRFHAAFGADTQAMIATVECPAIQQVVDRADGFIKGFTETDAKAKVVARVDGQCARDKALAASEDLLQKNPEVNVIYGGNGDSALGALAALQGANRGTSKDVFLVSHDGSEPELIELVNPTSGLKLSVANRPKALARATVDTLVETIQGKRAMDKDSEVRIPAEVLTPDNIEYLNKFLAEQYLSTTDLTKYAGSAAAAPKPAAFDWKGKKLGYIYLTLEHPYYQAHSKHVEDYAKEIGLELVERDGKMDAAVMASAMEDLIAQKVDGIVFALLDPAAAVPSIEEAQKAGIPVVTFAIRHGEGAQAPFVGIPEGEATEKAGIEAAKRFHATFGADTQAMIATVECPATQAVVDRADGFIKGFTATDAKAKVVARVDGKCSRDKALAATEDLLQKNPEVNVIYGGNGDSALGALAALQGANRGTNKDVFLVSHDGSEPELIELVNPKSGLKLAVANRPRELARATVDTMAEVLSGTRAMDKNSDVGIGAEVLTPDDITYLNKFLAEQYLSKTDLSQYAK